MTTYSATARAYSNIAFIKYWGNRDDTLRLPANGSISMNLLGLETVTTATFFETPGPDQLTMGGREQTGEPLARVSRHLGVLRTMAGMTGRAEVTTKNSFPTGTGIASSASAFAALTVAAAAALRLELSEAQLSAIARRGSGSASRSVPGGFVEWLEGTSDASSYALSIAPPEHWDLVDLVALISQEHKAVGSTGGHALAPTSPLQAGRLADAPRRLDECRSALMSKDFERFAEVVEHDALMMHAVMMTSQPPLLYWLPGTLSVLREVTAWRAAGIPVCFTIDAGPNVHVLTVSDWADVVMQRLLELEGVMTVLSAPAGGAAEVLPDVSGKPQA